MMTQTQGPRSPFVRLFVDYNPFYVMSAMCMLFGIFAVNDSLDWSPIPLKNLIVMIITLNVYEIALIGLAIFLLGVNVRRDALLLMLIEAFFLADVGFLNMEVFTANFAVGLIVNSCLMIAAVVKLAVLFCAAGIPVIDGKFAYVILELACLFAIPGVFAIVSQPNDVLPPSAVFAAWWLVGFLPVAFVIAVGSFEIFRKSETGFAGNDRIIGRALIVLPIVSLLAHLCLANWVYKVTFHPSNLSPLLLGAAVAIARFDRHVVTLVLRMRLGLVLPFVAVGLAALKFPKSMVLDLGPMNLSPLRLVLIAAAFVYLDGLLLYRTFHYAAAAIFCFASAGMGHDVTTINDNSIQASRWWWDSVKKLVPTTEREWGVASIAASFVLLLCGAMVSLGRKSEEETAIDGGVE
jgi:hypothetical protein